MDVEMRESEPLFRASKRRKVVLRKRPEHAEDEPTKAPPEDGLASTGAASPTNLTETIVNTQSEAEHSLSMAEILRRRKLGRSRRGGIEFSPANESRPTTAAMSQASAEATVAEQALTAVDIASSRFAPQTGQAAEVVNKHMMEYIDAKMAELRQDALAESHSKADGTFDADMSGAPSAGEKVAQRQPAGLGKLQEIDLGPDATLRNIARTEAAQRRLEAGDSGEQDDNAGRRVRLGKDGKPWRRRKRRNSEDLKRDKLVEEVLRETRLDIYDEPEVLPDSGGDQAADDRVAEQFRREFMDALNTRNNRRKPPAPAVVKGAKPEKAKGPKLGGSRNARAAMRAQEEAAAKKR